MNATTGDGAYRTEATDITSCADARTAQPAWYARLAITAAALLALVLLFWPTLVSMVSIWWRSETFAHGFLVFPISVFLIWRRRGAVARLVPRTDFRAIVLLVVLGAGWSVANVTDVLLLQQLAVVAMIPVLVWLLLGWPVARTLAFPLGFLVFAVPAGEALIPPMMDFTARFTVHALRFTGIPVYSDGTFFSIPSGDWSVVEGCSGVRYLIASLFLGTLYAYLTYRAFWRQALFVVLSATVPVIANGLRAYMIVMIAHLSDMKLALGIDHLIYGWVFFGIVMFLLFWLGTFWRERGGDDDVKGARPLSATGMGLAPEAIRRPMIGLLAGVVAIALWPAWAGYLNSREPRYPRVSLSAPGGHGDWTVTATPFSSWAPRYVKPTAQTRQEYSDGRNAVGLFIEYYRAQRQGAELINTQNVMVVQKHPVWRMPQQHEIEVRLDGHAVEVFESRLESADQNLLVWHWNWVAGHYLVNPYEGKLREAFAKLFGGNRDGAGIVIYTQMTDRPEAARVVLQRFIDQMLPAIQQRLQEARAG